MNYLGLRAVFGATLFSALSVANVAAAQDDEEGSSFGVEADATVEVDGDVSDDAAEASGDAEMGAEVETEEDAEEEDSEADADEADADEAEKAAASKKEEEDEEFRGWFNDTGLIGWDGNLETDIGYASYDFPNGEFPPSEFYDFRGRFVMGPTLHHDLGDGFYFRARGEVVAWIRDRNGIYQVNVDDAWGQFGNKYVDVKVGRFFGWWLFNKGMAFDLFTLEDTGAKCDATAFCADHYEVNHLFWRSNGPGDAAVHVYPIPGTLGIQTKLVYGKDLQDKNNVGGRVAADLDVGFLRLQAGGEYTTLKSDVEIQTQDINGVVTVCDDCDRQTKSGFGGSATLDTTEFGVPAELSVSGAQSTFEKHARTAPGDVEAGASGDATTFGGTLGIDVGSLVFGRSLWIGGAGFRTEVFPNNNDFQQHTSVAAFVLFPLGFNDVGLKGPGSWAQFRHTTTYLKFVLSQADALVEEDTGDGVNFIQRESTMKAARVRLMYMY
jgi:hypothetical protein